MANTKQIIKAWGAIPCYEKQAVQNSKKVYKFTIPKIGRIYFSKYSFANGLKAYPMLMHVYVEYFSGLKWHGIFAKEAMVDKQFFEAELRYTQTIYYEKKSN